MKTLSFIFILLFSITFTFSQNADSLRTITVNIDKLPSSKGHVILTLHNEQTFMKSSGIKSIKSKITDGKVNSSFEGIAPGNYAILVIHDTNDNNKMDFQPNGMPKEAYGASNNNMSFGPPQFSNAEFEVNDEDLEMKIIL